MNSRLLKPRYKFAQLQGIKFYKSLGNITPPVDPFLIIQNNPLWDIRFDDLEGEEGYTFKKGNKYRIYLDEKLYLNRLTFTAMHEPAHIILNHYETYDCTKLTEIQEQILDVEANICAGEILMPKYFIYESKLDNINDLSIYFNVSKSAIEARLKFLNIYEDYIYKPKIYKGLEVWEELAASKHLNGCD